MSRSRKAEKGNPRPAKTKGDAPGVGDAIRSRRAWGSTEKIKRRNRRTFVRLANKRRRADGKKQIASAT